MGLFGSIFGSVFDVVETPIAMAKDVIPGAGGYVDGNSSKTGEKIKEVVEHLKEVREDIEEL